jgi:hypothetical protein
MRPEIADAAVAFARRTRADTRQPEPEWTAAEQAIVALLGSSFGSASPAWERLNGLKQGTAGPNDVIAVLLSL